MTPLSLLAGRTVSAKTFANSLDPDQAKCWACSGFKQFDTKGMPETYF